MPRSAAYELPDPGAAVDLDGLITRLRALKVWAGDPSYEAIKDRLNAALRASGAPTAELAKKNTVADCFRLGRRRINADLMLAVVAALRPDPGYVAHWRQALRRVVGESRAASHVRVHERLPDDLDEFVGRTAEIEHIRRAVKPDRPAATAAIEGMAGVGKTRLAIHVGHRLRAEHRFERVLFVNLRGFHPDRAQPPADPAAVIEGFLRMLGVPGHLIPHDMSRRVQLYRERLAATRALLVLDNASDESQIRSLVADVPGCLTLITSRRRLAGLDDAVNVSLGAFTQSEALTFLNVAAARVPAGEDRRAPERLAQRCGYLPLAMGVMTGHMTSKSGWTLTDHADWLDERHRAHRLDGDVELALGMSYDSLPANAQRLFRLLALHPGDDIDVYAAAALAGMSPAGAREHLQHLRREHLVNEARPGRYGFHDLVRTYSVDRAVDQERPSDRRAALTRLLDHYVQTARQATDRLFPAGIRERSAVSPALTVDQALSWLNAECANILAAAGQATDDGLFDHVVQLAAALRRYLTSAGRYSDAVFLQHQASLAAQQSNDRAALAGALSSLGFAHFRLGDYPAALTHSHRALDIFRELADRAGEARARNNLGTVYQSQGQYAKAIAQHQQVLTLSEVVGDRFGVSVALGNLGVVSQLLGRYEAAVDHFRRARELAVELGDREGQARAIDHIGVAYQRQGRYQEALDCQHDALRHCREIEDRHGQARALTNLGDTLHRLGRDEEAAQHHRSALTIARETGDRGIECSALNGLGEATLTGELHRKASRLAAELGEQHEQARADEGLARICMIDGDIDQAKAHWQKALDVFATLGGPEADRVRVSLSEA